MKSFSDFRQYVDSGDFTEIDYRFAEVAAGASGRSDVFAAALLVSAASRHGSVCLDLNRPSFGSEEIPIPKLAEAAAESLKSFDYKTHMSGTASPLVLEGSRLYLRRYYDCEKHIADEILFRRSLLNDIDEQLLSVSARLLFSRQNMSDAHQINAALNCVRRRLSFISGGPGTGKTTTVVSVILLFIQQSLAAGCEPNIAICAPTGKAASHLKKSIDAALIKIRADEDLHLKFNRCLKYFPSSGQTVHRLLSSSSRESKWMRSALSYNLVVADETSMFDVSLMSGFLKSLGRESTLIFLGDRDQLSSVQAGSVLADICDFGENAFSADHREFLSRCKSPYCDFPVSSGVTLRDSISMLENSYRFNSKSGIGLLASAINTGDIHSALQSFSVSPDELEFVEIDAKPYQYRKQLKKILADKIERHFGSPAYFADNSSREEMLDVFEKFQILSCLRKGPSGSLEINAAIEEIIGVKEIIYHGMPLIVTQNDYRNNVYNGDMGVIARHDGILSACFKSDDGIRKISPSRLRAREKAYCLTVHKSQGSEFDNVIIILPPEDSRVLTRELLYTAVTRGKKKVTVIGSREVFAAGIKRKTERVSGLRERLWA